MRSRCMCIGIFIIADIFSTPHDCELLFMPAHQGGLLLNNLLLFTSTRSNNIMDSSAVPVKSAEGQDTQQRQVNSAVGNVEEATTLHPAAAVFRDEILGCVSESSKTVETSNARFRHIIGVVQEVKLACHTVSYRLERGEEGNVIYVDRHQTYTVKHKLRQDSIMALDDEERLVLPIEDAPAHPVEDCGVIGCIEFVGGSDFRILSSVWLLCQRHGKGDH